MLFFLRKKFLLCLYLPGGEKKKILIKLRQTLMWEKLLPWANGHKTSKENERKYRIGPWRKEQLRCSQRENSDLIFYEPKCPNSNSDLIFLLLYTSIFSLRESATMNIWSKFPQQSPKMPPTASLRGGHRHLLAPLKFSIWEFEDFRF